MKRVFFATLAYVLIIIMPCSTTAITLPQTGHSLSPAHNPATREYQDITQKNVDPQALFCTIQQELKRPAYRQEILPNDFSYLVQLLTHAKKTEQPRACAQSMISLFSNLLKGSQYVNAYALSRTLDQLPDLLKEYFVIPHNKFASFGVHGITHDLDLLDRFQQVTSQMMCNQFRSQYSSFKANPETFLNELSGRIAGIAEEVVNTEHLRQTVIKF